MTQSLSLLSPTYTHSDHNITEATVQAAQYQFNQRNLTVIQFVDSMGLPFTWSTVAHNLSHNSTFRKIWNQTWADVAFDFQWKSVPIHPATAETFPFYVALVPDTFFEPTNPFDFQEYFQRLEHGELVASFNNISGTAQLVSPKPPGDYGHIAAFCRNASLEKQHALWCRVGEIALQSIRRQIPVWCNTHGHGVPWLHVRFDSYLKYPVFPVHDQINVVSQSLWYEHYERCFLTSEQVSELTSN
ncbi:MAG: hypothetical protein ACFBSC_14315 [Microcoleaceae cyanobacterium]